MSLDVRLLNGWGWWRCQRADDGKAQMWCGASLLVPYKMAMNLHVFSAFVEDRIVGNVKWCLFAATLRNPFEEFPIYIEIESSQDITVIGHVESLQYQPVFLSTETRCFTPSCGVYALAGSLAEKADSEGVLPTTRREWYVSWHFCLFTYWICFFGKSTSYPTNGHSL